jgi:hypothetical protein
VQRIEPRVLCIYFDYPELRYRQLRSQMYLVPVTRIRTSFFFLNFNIVASFISRSASPFLFPFKMQFTVGRYWHLHFGHCLRGRFPGNVFSSRRPPAWMLCDACQCREIISYYRNLWHLLPMRKEFCILLARLTYIN